ncbi:MAG: hypothetical protein ACYCVE_08395 [Gemmatimonadaceae bacterium]
MVALTTLAAMGTGAAAVACGDNSSTYTPVAPLEASHMFWELRLQDRAITLSTSAPYDTFRLKPVAVDGQGNSMPFTGNLTFTTSDTHGVQVDSTGLLRAVAATTNVRIIVTLAAGDLIHSDTAEVNVLNATNPQPLATFTVNAGGPDTVQIARGQFHNTASLPVVASDASGNPIRNLAIDVRSLDTNMVHVCSVNSTSIEVCAYSGLTGGHPGFARVVASTTTYGARFADTLVVGVSAPLLSRIVIMSRPAKVGAPPEPTFGYGRVSIAPGGTVLWLNSPIFVGGYGLPIDIVFDDPSSATAGSLNCHSYVPFFPVDTASGNIAAFGDRGTTFATVKWAEVCRSRTFLKPGTYTYHSTLTPATGAVVVTDSGYVGG